jgi:hypothetical protein
MLAAFTQSEWTNERQIASGKRKRHYTHRLKDEDKKPS